MFDLSQLLTAEGLVALVSLTALEIVLGIDNIIFIAILSERLPEHQRPRARTIGLVLAMFQRIVFLLLISWIIRLDAVYILDWGSILDSIGLGGTGGGGAPPAAEALDAAGHATDATDSHGSGGDRRLSIKEVILLGGGLFLIAKATLEIHHALEGGGEPHLAKRKGTASFAAIITQIMLLDVVFSIDSVLTAIGLTTIVPAMVLAIVISVIVMIVFAGPLARFIQRRPTIKMLALAILVTIGLLLVIEAFEAHIPRGYLYFAMAFSLLVEMLNIRASRGRKGRGGGPEIVGESAAEDPE